MNPQKTHQEGGLGFGTFDAITAQVVIYEEATWLVDQIMVIGRITAEDVGESFGELAVNHARHIGLQLVLAFVWQVTKQDAIEATIQCLILFQR